MLQELLLKRASLLEAELHLSELLRLLRSTLMHRKVMLRLVLRSLRELLRSLLDRLQLTQDLTAA